jgi:glycerol kinase
MKKRYIMALDQGTTSSRAVIFDRQGKIVSMAAKEFKQIYPRPGWVEHDPAEIWNSQVEAARKALHSVNLSPRGHRNYQPTRDHFNLGPRERSARL